jgi:exodeoxyribonuclease VII small subunit
MKFEEGLRRLETIVNILDEGKASLDEALNLFKEGIGLTKNLSKNIEEIERKVDILLKKDDGSIEKKSFLQEET